MTMPPMASLNFLQRKKQIEKINNDNMVKFVFLKIESLTSVKIR